MRRGREIRQHSDTLEPSQSRNQTSVVTPDPAELEAKLTTVLDLVPEPQRQQAKEAVHEVFTSVFFHGPMPPPNMLRGYNEVSPGAADRIIAMAEKEQAHRHKWESRALSADRWYAMTSLIAGWSVAVALAVAAAVVGVWGDWRAAVALAATSATGMVWKLVQGRSETQQKQSGKPSQAMPQKSRDSKTKRR